MTNPKLPDFCYFTHNLTGKTIIVKRGENGYWKTDYEDVPADKLNEQLGVTKAQAAAMFTGSMFGFDCPGANPDRYDENGKPRK